MSLVIPGLMANVLVWRILLTAALLGTLPPPYFCSWFSLPRPLQAVGEASANRGSRRARIEFAQGDDTQAGSWHGTFP